MVLERSLQSFCCIVLQKLQNDLGQINLTCYFGPNCFRLIFILAFPYLINKALYGGVVILLCPI